MASNNKFEIEATVRHEIGKGASRRLRRDEKVPGVIYGGGKEPVSLSLVHKTLAKSLENEAFYSHILSLNLDKTKERVVLKALQRHPFKPRILHVDFQRVRSDEKLTMNIPLHFIGDDKAPGVAEGGLVSHIVNDVEVICLPDNLPEFISIDVSGMKLNDILHLSDITLPNGVELVALNHEDDKPIVSIHMPRQEEEPAVEEVAAPAEVPAMKQKDEDEGQEG